MAYAEAPIGGTWGNSFRVWVNSIRTYDGSPGENFEEWRAEGGVNRISGIGNRIWSSGASYTLQLGLNGVASSGGFSYDWNTALGTRAAWGTGTTRVYRDNAGNGFGFQSRMDVNLNNSPGGLTSGWVTSNDGLITRYRQALLTALSWNIYETDSPWVEFWNPSGAQVNAWFELPGITGGARYAQRNYVGSRHTWTFSTGEQDAIRAAMANTNATTLRYVIETVIGGSYLYDTRDATITLDNRAGQLNPTFPDFTYQDITAAAVAATGNNQLFVQGRSRPQVTVSTANKATAVMGANMSTYTFSFGDYSGSAAYSSSAAVTHNLDITYGVTGIQPLTVTAVDSRGNTTTVTKNVTVFPYVDPSFYKAFSVKYANQFDDSAGLTLVLQDTDKLAIISPMTSGGVDLNTVNLTSGVQYQLYKGTITYTATNWVNVTVTQEAGTGVIKTNKTNLQTSILNTLRAMGADNGVTWYLQFKITDEVGTQYFYPVLDAGRPIFRIGYDSNVYNNENRILTTLDSAATFASGPIVPNTSAGLRSFGLLDYIQGIGTLGGGSTFGLKITKAGVYRAQWQQLMIPTSDGYYAFQVNGSDMAYGYPLNGRMSDYGGHWTGPLQVNDTVRLNLTCNTSNIWAGPHSHFAISRISDLP